MAQEAEGGLIGVILAAGAGTRMGGPKALLVIGDAADGEPLARLHARRMREAGCDRVVIVTREEIAARGSFDGDGRVVVSGAPDPAGSLAIGVRAAAPKESDLLLITPVDAWPAEVGTIARLVDAVRQGAEAATPVYGGRGGHPVVVRARVLLALALAGGGVPRPLRDVLAGLETSRVRLEVADPSVVVDLDTPEDVLRHTGAPPRFG